MKIAGIVTIYKEDSDVLDNIDSYIECVDKLYVVDNNDNDDFGKKINSKKIKYLPNYNNIGVASALNIGAKQALKDGYKWLLTMDQDSAFTSNNDLKKMIDYLDNNDTKKIGLITPWHAINTNPIKPKDQIDHPLEVMTSGNIINLSAYEDVGGFKDEYFIDNIDIEYCMNLNSHGYHIDRLNYIELIHHLGDIKVRRIFKKKFICSNHNYIRRYYMSRNTFYLCDLYDKIYPDYCKFLKRALRGQFTNILLFEKDKIRKIRSFYRGYKDYKKRIVGKYPYKK